MKCSPLCSYEGINVYFYICYNRKALTEFFENVIRLSTKKFTGKDAVVYSGWIDWEEN